MKKDDLKKILEDDFFGDSTDSLDGLEDITLDLSDDEFQQEENEEEDDGDNLSVEPEINEKSSELDSEDKDIFDLDGFDFDEDEILLTSDLNLEELDKELVSNNDKEEPQINGWFDDITEDVTEILNNPVEKMEEEIQVEEVLETVNVEKEEEEIIVNIEDMEMDIEDKSNEENFIEDNNTFTNYVQNDTINIEDRIQDLDDDKGIEMVKPTLNYDDFSDAMNQEFINVKKLDFPEINNQLTGAKFKVDLFSNIPVTIDVFLGKTTLSLKDIHELSKGSVIELDKFYGEPLELKINGELIATGEVVSIDNKYGIMVKDIVKS